MKARLISAAALVLLLSGCNYVSTSTTSFVREPVAHLPNGDELFAESRVVQHPGQKTATTEDSYVIWSRSVAAGNAMTHTGESPAADSRRILVMKGDVAAWAKQREAGAIDSQIRVSADGDRAWQLANGHAIASFDHRAGTAIFGEADQPAWATATP